MIAVHDLRMVFPNGHEALRQVSVEVTHGEFVCIIGRSGAGKSTLLRCINGLLTPTSGAVTINGVPLTGASARERRRLQRSIGFIYQEFNLVERLSVMHNVLAGRLGHQAALPSSLFWFSSADRAIALHALERVNLAHRAGQRADSLSGGEKQRVAVARALAQRPVAMLADEPVASLDPELAWGVMTDLQRTAKESGIPTLVNIHDVSLARAFADRIIGIAGGVVVFDGPPAHLDEAALERVYAGSAAAFAGRAADGDADRHAAEPLMPAGAARR